MPPKAAKKGAQGPPPTRKQIDKKAQAHREVYPEALENVTSTCHESAYPLFLQEANQKWRLFQYMSQLRDLYIHKLQEDLELLDDQRLILLQLQSEEMQEQLAISQSKIQREFEDYESKKVDIINDRNNFIEFNIKSSKTEEIWARTLNNFVETNGQEYDDFILQDIRGEKFQIRKEHLASKKSYSEWGLKKLKRVFERIQKQYNDYTEETRKKKQTFDMLQNQNSKDLTTIISLNQKIVELQREKREIQRSPKIVRLSSDILDYKNEDAMYRAIQVDLQKTYVDEKKRDESKLEELANICHKNIQELEKDVKHIEKISKFYMLCSKYETTPEKSTQFPVLLAHIETSMAKKFQKNNKKLFNLMFRMARVDLEIDYMNIVKQKYEEENAELENNLKDALARFTTCSIT